VGKLRIDASALVPRAVGLILLAGPYLGRVTRHIASAAEDGVIPCVEVRLGDEGMSEDGLHPNDKGYRVIADRLGSLG
jgi:lysophospholipase L1-like esterase